MKKIISIILLLSFSLSLVACGKSEPKKISCEDIIKAYGDAGYYVTHGEHKTQADSSHLCYIKANMSEDPDSDYIYFITCFTEEQAEEAHETDKYNLAIWLYATVSGESRWLKSGTYREIEYSYYNSEMIKPFKELIK
nr:hypothetical protein [Oscillospiraceae bacterium]